MLDAQTTNLIAKPATTAVVAYAGHRMLYGNSFGMSGSATFGAAVGAGVLAADLITKYAGHGGTVEKSIEQRVLEVGLGSGLGVAAESMFFGVPAFDTSRKFGVAAVSEVIAEYAVNSFLGFR